jgi:XTP/dITP diphosphohydrolase
VLVLLRHAQDPCPLIAQGSWEGRILHQPRGSGGFGYDPLFLVPGQDCSAAELPARLKGQVSHRAKAMASLLAQLQQRNFSS